MSQIYLEECSRARSFKDLAVVGVRWLREHGDRVGVVEGPVSTGGLGSIEKNIEVFSKTAARLKADGHTIFDYAPFENAILRLKNEWRLLSPEHAGYCMPILEDFYAPLYDTGIIQRAWFIPDWESSFGSTWAHTELSKRKIEVIYLDTNWIKNLLHE